MAFTEHSLGIWIPGGLEDKTFDFLSFQGLWSFKGLGGKIKINEIPTSYSTLITNY